MSYEMCDECWNISKGDHVIMIFCKGCETLVCMHMLDATKKCSVCEPGEGEARPRRWTMTRGR